MTDDKIDVLIRQLASRDASVRLRAVSALKEIANKNPRNIELLKAVPGLIVALYGDPDMRWKVTLALIKIGEPAVPGLVGALKDKDVDVRLRAAVALADIKDPRAVPGLVGAMKDKDVDVRRNVTRALVNIGETAVPALINVLRWEDAYVRKNADYALGEIIPSLTDIRLRETEELLRKELEKAEGEEKKILLNWLDRINNRRNALLEPEAKKLKPPRRTRRKKPKKGVWRAVQ